MQDTTSTTKHKKVSHMTVAELKEALDKAMANQNNEESRYSGHLRVALADLGMK